MLPAVVMAAGLGTRLRPLTERFAKPVLPIDGEPVLATLLRGLEDAGCPEATVVVGHLGAQVRRLCESLELELPVRFSVQEAPTGSGGAVAAAAAEPPYLVIGADTVFTPGDVARFSAAFERSGAAGALALRPPAAPEGVRARDGRVERIRTDAPTHAGAPLWAVGTPLRARVAEPDGEPPYELAAAFQAAIDAGDAIAGIEIGPTRDLTTPVDLVLENFPYLGSL